MHLVRDPDASGLDEATARALERAFEDSEGRGLLELAGPLLTRPLPASLAWLREIAHGALAAVCAQPDFESQRRASAALTAAERGRLLERIPPMPGAEYASPELVDRLAGELGRSCDAALREHTGSVEEWLHALNPVWNTIGRVHFHLVERKDDPARPFAFMATYTTRVASGARAQHLQLGRALEEFAGNRAALLSLLQPVQRASATAPFLKRLVDEGQIFHPLSWTPAQALALLREVPQYEVAGIVVRVPDWWNVRRPPRPHVRVTVGESAPRGLGLDALLDFRVELSIGGESLSEAEARELAASAGGLVKLRGRWVELDSARLAEVLEHWKTARRAHRQGLSFAEAMRLLAGTADAVGDVAPDDAGAPAWTERVAGPWLADALNRLRDPVAGGLPRAGIANLLRPYQRAGVGWLYLLNGLTLGGCLADDMGLGKTIQVLALFARLKEDGARDPHLLVVPASLVANWESEARRFAPGLTVAIAHPSAGEIDAKAARKCDVVITTYGYLSRLSWATKASWDTVVLDEAQAIKNAGTAQARSVKALKSRARLALTGTPIENRLGDLWSLFDFLNPGLLGGAKEFTNRTRAMAAFAPLRRLVRPYILRRLKSDPRVIDDLPAKTEMLAYCGLTRVQAALYQTSVAELEASLAQVDGMKRRGLVLAFLTRFKQICNHPSQWTGDGRYRPEDSAKFARLAELCEPLAARQEKVLVFTQYREMTGPISEHLARVFGAPGVVLHGGTPVAERKKIVARFQEDDALPFAVLSLKAGGTGLNLTAASHVVHFDRWWNPAVEDQATDRAYRIGQRRAVMVHKFTCRGTVEERIEALLADKRTLSRELLESSGEVPLTELSDGALLELVRLDMDSALGDS